MSSILKKVKTKHVTSTHAFCDQTAPIFELNVDCLDRILDYLSMRDVILFGQTCKAYYAVCGEYFRLNYGATKNFHTDCGTYTKYFDRDDVVGRFTETTSFSSFMKRVEFSNSWNDIDWSVDDFLSLNHICFRDFADIYYPKNIDVDLDVQKSKMIKNILSKVGNVEIRNVRIDGNIFSSFLKSCANMKHLYVQHPQLGTLRNDEVNLWLHQKYPNLEHLELFPRTYRINELCSFFQMNQNVNSFSTNISCLWANKDELLVSNVHLENLHVKYFYNGSEQSVRSVCSLLNELHERGFYKKLHFNFDNDNFNQDVNGVEFVFTLCGLDTLHISEFLECHNLEGLNNIKELVLKNHYNFTDMDVLAKNLTNLVRLDLINAHSNDLLPFIRNSVKLKQMRIGVYSGDFDLKSFATERSKLFQARKLTIYVPDNIYLAIKWTQLHGETNLNSVEVKRTSYCYWDHR